MNKTHKSGLILILSLLFTCCGIIGKKNSQWKHVKQKKKCFVHIVIWPEETLTLIASWHTGNKNNVTALAEANPNINPNNIVPGDNIYIPAALLKTKKPMPKEFAKPLRPKVKKNPAPPKPPPEPEEFIPYGPK
jgi:hypothetical protein